MIGDEGFQFYKQLWYFYTQNRGKIRARYNGLTRKFLAYNDSEDNSHVYLRRPQFEALEMYVFIKEFMDNKQMERIFREWRGKEGDFSDASYYALDKDGQALMGTDITAEQMDKVFLQMKDYQESYPNYIYALTMGLGKTILMATCIFYEFLLARKYPKDKRFCHNALVFAPDKTVLSSLREIMTFDKSLVVPKEYAKVLDSALKFHFLDDEGGTLSTLDGSEFNIVISNTQKIIVKHRRKEEDNAHVLFDSGEWKDKELLDNQRFDKLCRLPQLGVYVDEAHHLFGADLYKGLRASPSAKTSLRGTINSLAEHTRVVACYNYTGTPYVKNQLLPEVVYACGLGESIRNKYLKSAAVMGYENVKSTEFLRDAINKFCESYLGRTYEGLKPKMAIYAATIEEAVREVRPAVEKILSEHGISSSAILLNVGDERYTKSDAIRDFNNLDKRGSAGDSKQFVILVEKGKEGWNCRSLFAVAMYRVPQSKIFVLQAAMRCLRAITEEQQCAAVFLSKDNFDILNDELHANFNMDIKDMTGAPSHQRSKYHVHVVPPERTLHISRVWHEYSIKGNGYSAPIDFKVKDIDLTRYESKLYFKRNIAQDGTVKEANIDRLKDRYEFTKYSLAAEVARQLNIKCLLSERILRECTDTFDAVLEAVNKYNSILYDIIIPAIFHTLYSVSCEVKNEEKEVVLLREPSDGDCYEFTARDDLVYKMDDAEFSAEERAKSFHADIYCFDSKPEMECFLQYIRSRKVQKVYFTGMFTAEQGELYINYYDPLSCSLRRYYPDFVSQMADGSYQLIEVKGDNKIDDSVVLSKKRAAKEMAAASGMEYVLLASSAIMKSYVLDDARYSCCKSTVY